MFLDKVTISKSSWHFKWLQSWRVHYWVSPTDFCTYFWLVVLQICILVGLAGFSGFLLAAYIAFWITAPWEAFICTVAILGIISAFVGFIFFCSYMEKGGSEKLSGSLVVQYVRAKKNKYCPFVVYTE